MDLLLDTTAILQKMISDVRYIFLHHDVRTNQKWRIGEMIDIKKVTLIVVLCIALALVAGCTTTTTGANSPNLPPGDTVNPAQTQVTAPTAPTAPTQPTVYETNPRR